ncbi:MAG TPA: type III-A CRISPR-associated protein Csm2 [Bryobacteraceae bacterium]|nr:type III-A CRISPR-associated protein Csm2 [Bryobacteraceae bacterium]
MSETTEEPRSQEEAQATEAPTPDAPKAEEPKAQEEAKPQAAPPKPAEERKAPEERKRPEGGRPEGRGQEHRGGGGREAGGREGHGGGGRGAPQGGPQGPRREGGRPDRGDDRRGGGGDRGRFEGPPEIDIEKLISDPLYLDNQAHGVVSRMRDMDSGTKSQLRRLYNAVRRAVRAPENERQQQFVMLRARLAYTIARHSLRSLDSLEKLLLQVTRKNDARGYERFRDLFEAIVAYNE